MNTKNNNTLSDIIKQDEVKKYLHSGEDFINEDRIQEQLSGGINAGKQQIRDIITKALSIETLKPEETAALLNVTDAELWAEMEEAAGSIKKKVYDNRIVTFAPLYISNLCVNNCLYCGFKSENKKLSRKILTTDELKQDVEVLTGQIGHKRLIVVYGEHPRAGIDYMVDTIKAIYDVKIPTRCGEGEIRRVNVNAPPLSIADLKRLKEIGIGTYQVFQETYHHNTYNNVHPSGTIKADYKWRLYCMHRAFEAGIDDVGIGALFGLYDWRFEVMGLLYHTLELERRFGVGPHTISFPRIEPAANSPFSRKTQYGVSDEDFKKLITVIRLSVPYTGMILTARESSEVRKAVLPLGVTQTDASPKISLGGYSNNNKTQEQCTQQFVLGDTRSLDEVVREMAEFGHITSFCTAGYRCGRTGENIMELLKCGKEGVFCKLNAILTFKEWLDDFSTEETRKAGEKILQKEIREIKETLPEIYPKLMEFYKRIENGERDLFF
jgi:2-iminoacetate synthase